MDLLTEIFAHKRRELDRSRQSISMDVLEARLGSAPPVPDFTAALRDRAFPAPRLIAEVKGRSPSKGVLSQAFDPVCLAQIYAANGARAISVLTDQTYFGGALKHLQAISGLGLGMPLLRKDFLFHRYQLLEARIAGASAVLLIAAMLADQVLERLLAESCEIGLTALVEVHRAEEIDRALSAGAQVIGINNRDLRDFRVDLNTSLELRPRIPTGIAVVAESGIKSLADVQRLAKVGIDAVLVGETLVTASDVARKVGLLSQVGAHPREALK